LLDYPIGENLTIIGYTFGVEGEAAIRGPFLNVHGYIGVGKSSNHGQIVIHNSTSATPAGCAAIDIQSTTKGLLLPRMSEAEMTSISSPEEGLMVYVNSGTGRGLWVYYGSFGWRILATRTFIGTGVATGTPP